MSENNSQYFKGFNDAKLLLLNWWPKHLKITYQEILDIKPNKLKELDEKTLKNLNNELKNTNEYFND